MPSTAEICFNFSMPWTESVWGSGEGTSIFRSHRSRVCNNLVHGRWPRRWIAISTKAIKYVVVPVFTITHLNKHIPPGYRTPEYCGERSVDASGMRSSTHGNARRLCNATSMIDLGSCAALHSSTFDSEMSSSSGRGGVRVWLSHSQGNSQYLFPKVQ